MKNKEKYTRFCTEEPELPVFHHFKWLDAVCDGRSNWDVVLLEENNEVIASMPLFYKKKYVIGQPPLTPYLGPYIKFPEGQKTVTEHGYERDVLEALIENIPDFKSLKMNFLPERKNWLPFYWSRFRQTTRYTFILKDLKPDHLFSNMKGSVRRQIRKASKSIHVDFKDDIELFYQINTYSFARQNMSMPYSLNFLKQLDQVVRQQRIILFARDEQNNIHAALYILWDKERAYYLMGGMKPEFRHSGANTLLFWEAFKYVSSFVSEFDFEGSMIKSIERFFSSFGAVQTPYFQIYKDNRTMPEKMLSELKSRL